jgi:hypothetical protein
VCLFVCVCIRVFMMDVCVCMYASVLVGVLVDVGVGVRVGMRVSVVVSVLILHFPLDISDVP